MKNHLPFDASLSPQVVALHGITGNQECVLGSPWKRGRDEKERPDGKPISENTIQNVIRLRLGYQATVHGFRAMATTIFAQDGWSQGAQDRQLTHVGQNKTRAAYNRAEH